MSHPTRLYLHIHCHNNVKYSIVKMVKINNKIHIPHFWSAREVHRISVENIVDMDTRQVTRCVSS